MELVSPQILLKNAHTWIHRLLPISLLPVILLKHHLWNSCNYFAHSLSSVYYLQVLIPMEFTCSFTGFSTLLRGPNDLETERKFFVYLLVTSIITELSNPVGKCVQSGPDFVIVCSVIFGWSIHCQERKRTSGGQTQWSCCESSDYSAPPDSATLISYFDCLASVWHHLLTTVAKISVWKLFRINLAPWGTSVSCYYLPNSVLNCMCSAAKMAIAQE